MTGYSRHQKFGILKEDHFLAMFGKTPAQPGVEAAPLFDSPKRCMTFLVPLLRQAEKHPSKASKVAVYCKVLAPKPLNDTRPVFSPTLNP